MSEKWRQQRRITKTLPIFRGVPGAEPGLLVAYPDAPAARISAIAYGAEKIIEKEITDATEIGELMGKWPVLWINVDGLGDVSMVKKIGELFHLHPLALEDAVNSHQRAKMEEYDGHLFVVARMMLKGSDLETEQLSLFLGTNFVITFQQCAGGDPFDPVRERMRKGHGRMRHCGPDYLAYALLDSVIDHYYPVLESYGERLDYLEEELSYRLDRDTIAHLHTIKRDLLTLRRTIWPLRDAMNALLRDTSELIKPGTRVFLRDCYDHVVSIMDLLETFRELGSSLTDVYLSSVSNRMSEVMKLLTIISTVFMPATLIAAIYGMNFNPEKSPLNMPELNWYFGYPFSLALMVFVTISILFYYKWKGWLGAAGRKEDSDQKERGLPAE